MNFAATRSTATCIIAVASLAFLPRLALGDDAARSDALKSVSATSTTAQAQTGTGGTPGTAKPSDSGATTFPSSANDSRSGKAGNAARPPVAYLLVPMAAPEQNQWMKKGCWAKFHDDQNFGGDSLTLMGPVDMPDMTGPFGVDWKGKVSSVETGPKARVLVYDNENYRDLVATFKPGQKSADVSKKMGFFDEFSSLKIACDNVKAASAGK